MSTQSNRLFIKEFPIIESDASSNHRPTLLTRLPNPSPPALKSLISASSSALCATLAPLRSLKLLPMLGVPSLPVGGAAAGLREVLFGCCCCDGCRVFSRVCVCWVGCEAEILWDSAFAFVFVVIEKCWLGGRGKGRRRIRV